LTVSIVTALFINVIIYFLFDFLKIQKMIYSKYKNENSILKKFSIIVPTWNNLEMLQFCIESIKKNSIFNHQIIVHINDGSDGTLEWVRSQNDIDYTHTQNNIGVCYALNLARSLVATDYILYLNDDMYVCPNWDKAFDDAINHCNSHLFFFSGVLIEPYESTLGSIHQNFGTSPTDFEEDKLLKFIETLPNTDKCGAMYPPNIVHRDLWDLVGGYSTEYYPGMGSDPDFVTKLWIAGVRNFKMLGNCQVYHFGKKSTNRIKHNPARKTYLLKYGHTFRTLRKTINYGKPIASTNKNHTINISKSRIILDRFKILFYVFKDLFTQNSIFKN